MSWDKNTVRVSNLDAIKQTLDNLGVPYQLTTIGFVKGRGLNDEMLELPPHPIRRLQYGDRVVLEHIEQDADCDTDDIITSQEFALEKEPGDWQSTIRTDKTGHYTDLEEANNESTKVS